MVRQALYKTTLLVMLGWAGCGDNQLPARLVGESAHFRLWMDTTLEAPIGGTERMLSSLEANWRDTRTLLAMPEGRVDYYWLTRPHLVTACSWVEARGCQQGHSVLTDAGAGYLPDLHELNHAYLRLRRSSPPLVLLEEGTAAAIGCGGTEWAIDTPPPWQSLVAAGYEEDVYAYGARFVHHLIATRGVRQFLAYYDQAPSENKPDLFAQNFRSFWGRDLDEAWAEMSVVLAGLLSQTKVWPICPCSLEPLIPDGILHAEPQQTDYWRLPDVGDDTLELSSFDSLHLRDCAAEVTNLNFPKIVLARLQTPHHANGYPLTGKRGHFLSEACDQSDVYELGPQHQQRGSLSVVISPWEATPKSLYLSLKATIPLRIWSFQSLTICPDCSSTGTACTDLPPQTRFPLDGLHSVRVTPIGRFTASAAIQFDP